MTGWYLNRLRTLSPAEFPYRIRQFIRKKAEQYLYPEGVKGGISGCSYASVSGFGDEADRLYPDEVSIFGKPLVFSDAKIDWHKDIFSGNSFPLTFSKNINIRNNPDLSAKNVWEVNRLLFLPQIALNYRKTKDSKYLELFIAITKSWKEANPYLKGVNWYSNIEINIRLINWYLSWVILDAATLEKEDEHFGIFVRECWLPLVYQHCRYSFDNPSKFSSSNNHLIAEYAGLFVASSLWKFRESRKWLEYSRRGLEKEIVRQHSSGINREEAAEYIQFITDFFLIALLAGERSGNQFSEGYRQTLSEIFRYILVLLDSKGNYPKYGDEDDGRCFLFDTDEDHNNFRSLLTSAAIVFRDPVFKAAGNGTDNKNRILFGTGYKKILDSLPDVTVTPGSVFYKPEGHYFFKRQLPGRDIFFHFDAAPLGFLSIAAHGHADALSFIMHINGQPLFIDSGTYTYHTEPAWRQYFIGTLAHNTVRINNHNQASSGGPTMWLNHFRITDAALAADGNIERLSAEHDGYKNDGVVHRREITFNKTEGSFIIRDDIILKKKQEVKVEIPFHIHPSVSVVEKDKSLYSLENSDIPAVLFLADEKLNQRLVKGQTSPEILGWYSASFMKKVPAYVIYCYTNIKETTGFKFEIKLV